MKTHNILNPRSISGTGFLTVLTTILIIAPTIGLLWTYTEHKQKQRDIVNTRTRYIDSQKTKLKNDIRNVINFIDYKKSNTIDRIKAINTQRVHNAYSLASHIYSMDRDALDPDRLKFHIIETLRPFRWNNGTGYYFILDMAGNTWLNADRPDLEGQNIMSHQDITGNFIIRDMVRLARDNESGFYQYAWTKPGMEGHHHIKLTYVKSFDPFDWVIGTGSYLDDMTANIQEEVITRIRQIRDHQNHYIFVLQNNGFCLSHPIEKFNRRNIINETAEDGRFIIKELLEIAAAKDGGFLEYPWEKPVDGETASKLSYAVRVKDWNWTIGAGIYLDDIDNILAREMARFKEELRNNILIIMYISIGVIVLALVVGFIITQRLYRGISAFTAFFKKAANEDTRIDDQDLVFAEFKILGELANQMLEDRNQKENALKQSIRQTVTLQNLLKNITDSMPSVLIAVDKELKVIQWNKQAEEKTGKTFDQVALLPVHTVFPLTDSEQALISKSVERGVPCMDTRVEKQSVLGASYENITIYPLVNDHITGAVIRIDDVTENIKMEEMMIQSEKMMSVGGLAAGMAHEINNPLSGIIGNTDVLKNRLFNDLPANHDAASQQDIGFEKIKAYAHQRELDLALENIRKAGSRAATIVSDMLSFSRKSASSFAMMDLSKLLDKTLELASTNYDLKKRFDFKQIKIHRNYQPIPKIPCEGSKIQQVFLNILTNGAHAMAQNTDEDSPAFNLTIRQDNTFAIVEIQDNGPGMDKETAKRIFEPFFTTKEVGIGTGLGLSVSYFIVTDHHKGSIKVDSSPGKGTRFTIQLPKAHRA